MAGDLVHRVRRCVKLPVPEKAVLAYFAEKADRAGIIRDASLPAVARAVGMSRRTVSRIVRELHTLRVLNDAGEKDVHRLDVSRAMELWPMPPEPAAQARRAGR